MTEKFLVNSSPHYRSDESIRSVMGDVLIALLPALAVGVVFFGFRVLSLTAVTVAACIAFESLFNFIRKKKNIKMSLLRSLIRKTVCIWLTWTFTMALV